MNTSAKIISLASYRHWKEWGFRGCIFVPHAVLMYERRRRWGLVYKLEQHSCTSRLATWNWQTEVHFHIINGLKPGEATGRCLISSIIVGFGATVRQNSCQAVRLLAWFVDHDRLASNNERLAGRLGCPPRYCISVTQKFLGNLVRMRSAVCRCRKHSRCKPIGSLNSQCQLK